jgi:hypothetical protein
VLFFSTALFLSCKKDKPIVISVVGKISDPNQNNKAVQSATITIYSKKVSGGSFSNNYALITSVTSNSSGNYELNFERENAIDYKIVISKENYFSTDEIINSDEFSTESNNVINYNLYPKAWVKLRIVNDNPVNSNDRVDFNYLNSDLLQDCESCCTSQIKTFFGEVVDETFMCETWAFKTIGYQALVTKLNLGTVKNGSFSTSQGDTTFVTFAY